MPSTTVLESDMEKEFVAVAMQLYSFFPELDLSFNLLAGTGQFRCFISDHPNTPIELALGLSDTQKTVHEAVFAIKALTGKFDA